MMTDLGVPCAENEMEPRVVARHRIRRERRSTSLSEPVRQVVAAWIVALLVLAIGLSVLTVHERSVRENSTADIAVRWHPPPIVSAEASDAGPCCSGIRACRDGLLAKCDNADWTFTQSRGDSASMCSSNDHRGAQDASDYC
jgi:hypothetical protein